VGLISVILINQAEAELRQPRKSRPRRTYCALLIITLVLFSVVAGIHKLAGYWAVPVMKHAFTFVTEVHIGVLP